MKLSIYVVAAITCLIVLNASQTLSKKPNILFILTDDQDVTLGGETPMVKTKKMVGDMGIHFKNMFVSSPLCCPSRSSIITGRYVHNHHAINNSLDGNCSSRYWQTEQEAHAFPTFLQGLGYSTFFAGKYLNQYGFKRAGGVEHVPPGWNVWNGLVGNSQYYNYELSVNGKGEKHGNQYPQDYLTDVIHKRARKFLDNRHKFLSDPFFMMLATPACHAPFTPAPQHKDSYANMTAPRDGSYNVKPKDKHWLIQQTIVPMPNDTVQNTDDIFRNRWRTLQSVDDMVADLIQTLDSNGELENTYVFFSSDNGYHLGKGTTHNTNGIIIQRDTGQQLEPSTSMCRDRKHTIEAPAEPAMHYQGQKRRGPIQFQGENLDLSRCPEVHTESIVRDRAYFLAKYCQTDGLLPGWTGWNQVLHKDSHPINNVGYLPIIDSSPTDKATVQTILGNSLDIAHALNLQSIVLVMDQAIYAKAQEIRWQGPLVFRDQIIVRLGEFYTAMAFLGAVGERFQDLGLSGQFGLPYDKRQLYEFDIRVPLMVRGPGIKPGQVSEEAVMNIDFAPTFVDIAESPTLLPNVDGISILPILHPASNSTVPFRHSILIEHTGEYSQKVGGCPQYDGQGMNNCDKHCVCEDSRNNTYGCVIQFNKDNVMKYCEFMDNDNFSEIYDTKKDPHEFNNLKSTIDPKQIVDLGKKLRFLANCAGPECNSEPKF